MGVDLKMSNVYYKRINSHTNVNDIKEMTKELLNKIISEEDIKLEEKIPLKVHFGERGNVTYIKPENFEGIIEFLREKDVGTCFIETSVLYGGQRSSKDSHLQLAQ